MTHIFLTISLALNWELELVETRELSHFFSDSEKNMNFLIAKLSALSIGQMLTIGSCYLLLTVYLMHE